MSMKLGLKIGGRQTVTPQLAQSIRLLQLDTPELLAEIDQTLLHNVMLERDDTVDADDVIDDGGILDMDAVLTPAGPDDSREWDEHMADLHADYMPDTQQERHATPVASIQVQILDALRTESLSTGTAAAALAILKAIDEDGRLELSLTELAARRQLPLATLQVALARVREHGPAGYAAQDLAECLRLQLHVLPASSCRSDALALLDAGLLDVGRFGPEGLRRRLGWDETRFGAALNLLRGLDFRPGRQPEDAAAIIPDLVVCRRAGRWQVELHPRARPRLRINHEYEQLLARNRSTGGALRGQLQDARSLLRGLEMRNDTLLKTGRAVLRHQFAFLTGGDAALRPLKLRDVATMIGMHESTVSRVTTGKYVQTPRGLFELRHFFSVTLRGDDDASGAAAKAELRRLIDAESAQAPLSDAQITRALAARGIQVVRRTVAKYREAMGIPTATLRRLTASRTSMRSA